MKSYVEFSSSLTKQEQLASKELYEGIFEKFNGNEEPMFCSSSNEGDESFVKTVENSTEAPEGEWND